MKAKHPKSKFVLGADLARLGEDKTVFVVIEKQWDNDILKVVYIEETHHKLATDAIGRIGMLDKFFNFDKILVDSTGLGGPIVDVLKTVVSPWKVIDVTFTVKTKIDMYSNVKTFMSRGKLKIPNNKKLIFELSDFRYEITDSKKLTLHHSDKGHDDYCDALALACYGFSQKQQYQFALGGR